MSEKTNATPVPERVLTKLVYLGVKQVRPTALDADDRTKSAHVYAVIADDGSLSTEHVYEKALGGGSPGTMCTFDFTPDGQSVYTMSRKYVGQYPDHAKVAEWQAVDDANRRALEVARAELRASEERLDLALLEPFRRAYASMPGPARVQLIARIAAYVGGMTESRMRLARKRLDAPPKKKGAKR